MLQLSSAGRARVAFARCNRLGPLARKRCRAPLRDYRVRMKYVLVKQGVLRNTYVRAPFPSLTDEDRRDIDLAFERHRLGDPRFLPAGRA
jgi:4-hydroxy-tetrahydrodipicolinate synthase